MQCTDLFAVTVTFLWQTTETVLGVAPLPGSTIMSHSAESLGRTALKDRPIFTVALQQIHTYSTVQSIQSMDYQYAQISKKQKTKENLMYCICMFLSADTEAFITNKVLTSKCVLQNKLSVVIYH